VVKSLIYFFPGFHNTQPFFSGEKTGGLHHPVIIKIIVSATWMNELDHQRDCTGK